MVQTNPKNDGQQHCEGNIEGAYMSTNGMVGVDRMDVEASWSEQQYWHAKSGHSEGDGTR